MKKYIAAILTALALLSLSCSKQELFDKPNYVFTFQQDVPGIFGQSNGSGRTSVNSLTAEQQKPFYKNGKGVYIMAYSSRSNDSFQYITPGQNNGDRARTVGIQTYLGLSLLERQDKDYFIFQATYSGKPAADFTDNGAMLEYIKEKVPAIKDYFKRRNKQATFKNAIWYQGETEARSKTFDTAVYRVTVTKAIENYRKVTGFNTRFFIVQFPECYEMPGLTKMRALQASLAETIPNCKLIPSDPLDDCKDPIHAGEKTLRRIAAFVEPFVL